MSLTKTQIEHIAKLARLELSPEEKTKFTGQLRSILDYFNKLQEVDTKGVGPMNHSIDIKNVNRADEVKDCAEDIKSKILDNAPDRSGDYFKVNKIL